MVTALVITVILFLLGGVIMLEAGEAIVARLLGHRVTQDEGALPFLIVPMRDDTTPVRPIPVGPRVDTAPPIRHDIPVPLPVQREPGIAAATPAAPVVPSVGVYPSVPVLEAAHAAPMIAAHTMVPAHMMAPARASAEPMTSQAYRSAAALPVDGATIVFRRPSDELMHLLPGRLQVMNGAGAGEDIRLVGSLDENPSVILGREVDDAHGVSLHSPTVSRRHACMTYTDGRWTIENLSQTNPVLVNDHSLRADGRPVPLADGDRIALGEVVLQFHAH